MNDVVIYSKAYCPYCKAAKGLFDKIGVGYREFDISNSPSKAQEMKNRSQRKTVPQIFFGKRHIGGYDDLVAYFKQKAASRG